VHKTPMASSVWLTAVAAPFLQMPRRNNKEFA
jgi:hypothetical protein